MYWRVLYTYLFAVCVLNVHLKCHSCPCTALSPGSVCSPCSITCQNKCTCFQWFSPLEATLAIYMLALALYNDNGPFTAALAADVTWKNYRRGFLPITDSSGNQLSVLSNRQNRYIGRPLVNIFDVFPLFAAALWPNFLQTVSILEAKAKKHFMHFQTVFTCLGVWLHLILNN